MLADHAVKSVVDLPTAASNIVVPGYFEAMQVPLLQGRFFTESDNERSRLVAIINQNFAQRYWPKGSAVGKLIREGGPQGGQPYREIIGVVADVKQSGLDSDPHPEVYLPVTQFPFAPWNALQGMTFVVRTEGDPMGIADRAKNEINLSDKDLPVTSVRPMTEYISESTGRRRFATLLLALFAALALMLSAVGTYGVMAYSVSQRRREISLRMALGATAAGIRALVLREVLSLAFLGIGIGSVGALISNRWLASLLFGVRTTDPLIFGSVAALLLFVALLASYVPLRRAVAVDPATALRAE
jgi:predicted permease